MTSDYLCITSNTYTCVHICIYIHISNIYVCVCIYIYVYIYRYQSEAEIRNRGGVIQAETLLAQTKGDRLGLPQ